MSDQLQIFGDQNFDTSQTLSLSDRLARILAWLESELGWKDKEVVLSSMPSDLSGNADLTFLSGKMLKERSAQTLAQTFGEFSKPLPTLGVIDLNGNSLIQHGYYPKIESGYTLSDILQHPDEISSKYFLSEKAIKTLQKHDNNPEMGYSSAASIITITKEQMEKEP